MRIPKLAQIFVATALLVGPGLAAAQTVDRDDVRTADRGGFDLGWLGLLGLAGLVGLKGRDKFEATYKSTASSPATRA